MAKGDLLWKTKMINENAAPIVLDIAKGFIAALSLVDAQWETGYFRFSVDEFVTEVKGSYVSPVGIKLLDVLRSKDFFHPVAEQGQALIVALGRTRGVMLFIVRSDFEYEIKFDFENLGRWKISKTAGGTGIPQGL